MAMTLGYWDLR
uniref:Uncharacterized protein n=2 Tax=Caprinae TaxID=9963 RepID=A0A8C2XX85_CAPHI